MSSPEAKHRRRRSRFLHAYRVGVFVLLVVLIHAQHRWFVAQKRGATQQLATVEQVGVFFPKAARVGDWDAGHGGQNVFDRAGRRIGHVIQTSPEADDVIGFSGPSNTLLAFDAGRKIIGIGVLRSDDTREHLEVVSGDRGFLAQWNGLTRDEAAALAEVDTVSGATLTSTAIADGIATRLGRKRRTDRFPDQITLTEVQAKLPAADALEAEPAHPGLFRVRDAEGGHAGYVARTSPHADGMIGYQGPTDVVLVLDTEKRLLSAATRSSYDNEPYVGYLEKDPYFYNTFVGFALDEIAQLDPVDAGLDGVSGATKTSITVSEAIIFTAGELTRVRPPVAAKPLLRISARNVGTSVVVLVGLVIAFTRLRGRRWLRVAFHLVLIGYLGFVNADMVSQALLVGWAQNGIAWRIAPGLVLLTAAALLAPIFTGRQVFCTHLCPYGAVQDLVARRLPWKPRLAKWLNRFLDSLPVVLLLLVILVAMGHLRFSLVGIEPFDAFMPRIAGRAAIAIAVIGLVAALFIPRAYCRYGCPTGAMLKFLRWNSAADRFGRGDVVAAALLMLAVGIWFWR